VWDYVKQFKENNRKINEVCRNISEKHLIKIEKKVVYRTMSSKTSKSGTARWSSDN
jgi:hypothetical protein